jgi:hypothetical protein
LDTFVAFGFTPLQNPVLRNMVDRWITIAQARKLDADLGTLLDALNRDRQERMPNIDSQTPTNDIEIVPSSTLEDRVNEVVEK